MRRRETRWTRTLNSAELRRTSLDLIDNLEETGLPTAEIARDLGWSEARLGSVLRLAGDHVPADQWELRDDLVQTLTEAGRQPIPFTVLTEHSRQMASGWFDLRTPPRSRETRPPDSPASEGVGPWPRRSAAASTARGCRETFGGRGAPEMPWRWRPPGALATDRRPIEPDALGRGARARAGGRRCGPHTLLLGSGVKQSRALTTKDFRAQGRMGGMWGFKVLSRFPRDARCACRVARRGSGRRRSVLGR